MHWPKEFCSSQPRRILVQLFHDIIARPTVRQVAQIEPVAMGELVLGIPEGPLRPLAGELVLGMLKGRMEKRGHQEIVLVPQKNSPVVRVRVVRVRVVRVRVG